MAFDEPHSRVRVGLPLPLTRLPPPGESGVTRTVGDPPEELVQVASEVEPEPVGRMATSRKFPGPIPAAQSVPADAEVIRGFANPEVLAELDHQK